MLIKQDGLKRAHWKLGIVQHLYPGRDNHVRAVQVKTKDGILLQRPVTLLYPLEIETNLSEVTTEPETDQAPAGRKQRAAGMKAKKAINRLFNNGQDDNT